MPAYQYVAKARLKVGDGYREPGELVPEANEWPNVGRYISAGQIEAIPIATRQEQASAVLHGQLRPQTYPTHAPADYDAKVPTPVREGEQRRTGAGEGQQEVRCWSCRELNWLSDDLPDTATWKCWRCNQPQTLVEANKHSAPTHMGEYMHIRMRQEEARQ